MCLCHMHTRDQGRIKERGKIRRQLDRKIIKRGRRESEKEGERGEEELRTKDQEVNCEGEEFEGRTCIIFVRT